VRVGEGEYDLPVYFDVDQFNATDYGPFADWNSNKGDGDPAIADNEPGDEHNAAVAGFHISAFERSI
jgi:hypothetical protein